MRDTGNPASGHPFPLHESGHVSTRARVCGPCRATGHIIMTTSGPFPTIAQRHHAVMRAHVRRGSTFMTWLRPIAVFACFMSLAGCYGGRDWHHHHHRDGYYRDGYYGGGQYGGRPAGPPPGRGW
ncbi:hypothetical protein C3920_00715 [Novacetimonas pomaceti]|uniref:Lipoprotein n=2 Tax=Novacetimonas pomaceti TaxID=2021998 RepID=A0ABX5P9Y2_9PROT|nr:hypothetical protein C3920_00715 [Novacetimonas pomaceti]